jgi:hypothetical protein
MSFFLTEPTLEEGWLAHLFSPHQEIPHWPKAYADHDALAASLVVSAAGQRALVEDPRNHYALTTNPLLVPDLVERLLVTDAWTGLVARTDLTPGDLEALTTRALDPARPARRYSLTRLCANPSLPPSAQHRLLDAFTGAADLFEPETALEGLWALAANASLAPSVLEALLESRDPRLLSERTDLSEAQQLRVLAGLTLWVRLRTFAANRSLTPHVLREVAASKHASRGVLKALAANPSTPPDLQRTLLEGFPEEVASNKGLDPVLLRELLDDPVRRPLLAANRALPQDVLEELLGDPELHPDLLRNPGLPAESALTLLDALGPRALKHALRLLKDHDDPRVVKEVVTLLELHEPERLFRAGEDARRAQLPHLPLRLLLLSAPGRARARRHLDEAVRLRGTSAADLELLGQNWLGSLDELIEAARELGPDASSSQPQTLTSSSLVPSS